MIIFFNQLSYGICPYYFFETSWTYCKGKLKVEYLIDISQIALSFELCFF